MGEKVIHSTAIIRNSEIGTVKLYRNVQIEDSIIKDNCSIGDDSNIERSSLENNVVINRRSYINDSYIGMYSYAGINTIMNWARVGRFCSIGRNVDIGGFDHDYKKVTTMPAFRIKQMCMGGGKLPEIIQEKEYCEIGNDVWISAGAQILHKVKIGDGAVIGAGAVVTHDISPYAIAVGVPAKIIGYRCKKQEICELLKLNWWNWPEKIILDNIEYFMNREISRKTISYMKKIAESL